MNSVFLTITIPFVGAFIIACLPKKIKPLSSLFVLVATFLSSLFCIFFYLRHNSYLYNYAVTAWLSFSFLCDGLSSFMAMVSSFVACLIALYALEYMRGYEKQDEFYFWMVLFVGSMMGLIFSANLLLMYCFWEITAVCSWRLISFYRKEEDAKAADRAFLITFFGASFLLVGIILIFLQFQTLDIFLLKGKALADTVAFFMLAGIIAKSAQLPLQTWLPDAGVAPTPVTALLHAAVLVKIGVYAFARFFGTTFLVSAEFLKTVLILSVFTIIVSAGSALVENNIKRILAYSTVSQLGYMLFAFALGGKEAVLIGLIYILAHSLAKAGLFLCAGIVEHSAHTKDINELGGFLKAMPLVAVGYILCAFSIIGIPPFLGFWPKFFLIIFSVKQNYIGMSVFLVVGAFLTLLYLFRLFDKVFLGTQKKVITTEKVSLMTTAVLIFGVISLICGLGFNFLFNFIQKIL